MKVIKPILLTILFVIFQCVYVCAQNLKKVEIESRISNILEEHHIPGAAVALISKDSLIWMGTFGLADVVNKIPVTDSTLFATGSISKTFVSSAAMIAQEKGLLSINDPLEKLVPSLEHYNQWKQTNPVRLIHLLEHTSGFDEAHFHLFPRANSITPFNEVMKMSKTSLNTRWKPGRYFEYNNLGYIASAYVIEEHVEGSFENFVKKNLLLPLEMENATYHPKDNLTSNFSKGYEGNTFKEVPFPDIPQWPAGYLTTSIMGMSRFTSMFLNNGMFNNKQILSSASVKQMETPKTTLSATAGIQYGYGKGLWGNFERGYHFYGHTGRIGGFLSEFGYSRELDLGYVVLINSAEGTKAIKAIKKLLLSFVGVSKKVQNANSSTDAIHDLSYISGGYQPITSIPQLGKIGYFIYRLIDIPIIKEENGQLFQSTVFGDRQVLLHVQGFLFKNPGESMATSAFVKDSRGNWQWQTDEASYRQIPTWWAYAQFYLAAACLLFMIIGFTSLLIWISIRLIRKKRKNIQLQILPFLAICSLLGMITSIVLFYDPEKMYSLGAILFLIFGWSFFIFSFLGLIKIAITIYRKVEVNAWIKYHSLSTTLACCFSASYLLYWGGIGLMLWNY